MSERTVYEKIQISCLHERGFRLSPSKCNFIKGADLRSLKALPDFLNTHYEKATKTSINNSVAVETLNEHVLSIKEY